MKNTDYQLSTDLIRVRTYEPGDYTISSGRICFTDSAEFSQMKEFISNSSIEDIEYWEDRLGIETSSKAYRAFNDLICDSELSDAEFLDYLDEYSEKINAYQNDSSEYEIEPKYKIYNEFFNLDGEFKIGNTIMKIIGDNLISITRPGLVTIGDLDEETVTNLTNGVIVSRISPLACICDSKDDDTHNYGNHRRIKTNYEHGVSNDCRYFQHPLNPDIHWYSCTPTLYVNGEAKRQKRYGFIVHWWACDIGYLLYDFEDHFTTDLPGISSPVDLYKQQSGSNICKRTYSKYMEGDVYVVTSTNHVKSGNICVTDIDELGRVSVNDAVEIICN